MPSVRAVSVRVSRVHSGGPASSLASPSPLRLYGSDGRAGSFHQGDDAGPLGLTDAPFPALSAQVCEAVKAGGVEPLQPAAHRLLMATQFLGDRWDLQPGPTQGQDPAPLDLAGRGMACPGQLSDGHFLSRIGGWTRAGSLTWESLPGNECAARFKGAGPLFASGRLPSVATPTCSPKDNQPRLRERSPSQVWACHPVQFLEREKGRGRTGARLSGVPGAVGAGPDRLPAGAPNDPPDPRLDRLCHRGENALTGPCRHFPSGGTGCR